MQNIQQNCSALVRDLAMFDFNLKSCFMFKATIRKRFLLLTIHGWLACEALAGQTGCAMSNPDRRKMKMRRWRRVIFKTVTQPSQPITAQVKHNTGLSRDSIRSDFWPFWLTCTARGEKTRGRGKETDKNNTIWWKKEWEDGWRRRGEGSGPK